MGEETTGVNDIAVVFSFSSFSSFPLRSSAVFDRIEKGLVNGGNPEVDGFVAGSSFFSVGAPKSGVG